MSETISMESPILAEASRQAMQELGISYQEVKEESITHFHVFANDPLLYYKIGARTFEKVYAAHPKDTVPYYRLERLIIEKYGEENYGAGIQTVTAFLNEGNDNNSWNELRLLQVCYSRTEMKLGVQDLLKFQQLFGLQMPEDFYTKTIRNDS